jgi:hypothetical protein
MDAKKGKTRKESTPIKVWVTPEEKAAIAAKADAHSLSASSYLRRLGLALPVESTIDQRAILDLVKIGGSAVSSKCGLDSYALCLAIHSSRTTCLKKTALPQVGSVGGFNRLYTFFNRNSFTCCANCSSSISFVNISSLASMRPINLSRNTSSKP